MLALLPVGGARLLFDSGGEKAFSRTGGDVLLLDCCGELSFFGPGGELLLFDSGGESLLFDRGGEEKMLLPPHVEALLSESGRGGSPKSCTSTSSNGEAIAPLSMLDCDGNNSEKSADAMADVD